MHALLFDTGSCSFIRFLSLKHSIYKRQCIKPSFHISEESQTIGDFAVKFPDRPRLYDTWENHQTLVPDSPGSDFGGKWRATRIQTCNLEDW